MHHVNSQEHNALLSMYATLAGVACNLQSSNRLQNRQHSSQQAIKCPLPNVCKAIVYDTHHKSCLCMHANRHLVFGCQPTSLQRDCPQIVVHTLLIIPSSAGSLSNPMCQMMPCHGHLTKASTHILCAVGVGFERRGPAGVQLCSGGPDGSLDRWQAACLSQ